MKPAKASEVFQHIAIVTNTLEPRALGKSKICPLLWFHCVSISISRMLLNPSSESNRASFLNLKIDLAILVGCISCFSSIAIATFLLQFLNPIEQVSCTGRLILRSLPKNDSEKRDQEPKVEMFLSILWKSAQEEAES